MTAVAVASAGLVLFGPAGAVVGVLAALLPVARRNRSRRARPPIRPVLLVLLVELRSGLSVLSALQSAHRRFPGDPELSEIVAVAGVSGLGVASERASDRYRGVMTHLTRSQLAGSSAADAVRRILVSDMARERSARLARLKSLPVRLMVPLTMLILPGVVLLGYGPALIGLFRQLSFPFE